MKIGIFGGSFNPPHIGHLIAADSVLEQLRLDKVLFIPASIPPHKKAERILDAHHRLLMVEYAIRDNPRFELSDLEIQRGGLSYTVDTLRTIAETMPGANLHLLLGSDMLMDFPAWRSPDEILVLAELVALTRPGFPIPALPPQIRKEVLEARIPEIGISSSEIRRRVREKKSIRYLVPPEVHAYIEMHRLYQ
jgi:nicotinate-nucleotide adenylyltransferase